MFSVPAGKQFLGEGGSAKTVVLFSFSLKEKGYGLLERGFFIILSYTEHIL